MNVYWNGGIVLIDNYLLEELVTFAHEKTLAKTAEKLLVTQPTITRGMQKLEEQLDVKLFDRQPNRILLTDTGKLAADKAQAVLQANQDFVSQVRNYADQRRVFNIGSVAPGPQFILQSHQADFSSKISVEQQLVQPDDVAELLNDNHFSIIISNHEIQNDEIESLYLGPERLFVNLDQFMYLANMQQVSFTDLKGLSFVVVNDIGPWKDVIQQNIPDAKFLYQGDVDALNEITKYSNFPYFTTNITADNPEAAHEKDDRVQLPITDESATMTFYASYLIKQRKQVSPLLKEISQFWPK